jgi:MFS family permease
MHPTIVYILFISLWGAGMGATATTYSPFLLARGLSLSDIASINLFFWISVSASELPTGLFADGKGRAWSIRTGMVFHVVGYFGYVMASSFWQAVCCECIIGVGIAFLSGAQQAWLTDALIKRGESKKLGRAFGTAAASRAVAAIVAGVIGALLGSLDLRLGWVLAGTCHLGAMFIAFRRMNGDGEPAVRMTERQAFSASFSATRRVPGLGWAMAMAIVFGFVLPFNHFWSPFFIEKVGQAGLSYVWAPLLVGVVVGGLAVRRGGMLVGTDRRGIVVSHLITGGALAAAGLLSGFALPFAACIIHEFGRGMYEPLMETYVQKRVESGYRATYSSVQSLIQRAGFVVIIGGVILLTRGMPSNANTVSFAWVVSGALMVACAIIGLLACRSKSAAVESAEPAE